MADRALPVGDKSFAVFLYRKKAARWRDRAKATVRHRELQRASGSVLSVASVAAAAKVAYQLQGDPELSTKSAFLARQALRRHPLILAELERWWQAALQTARQNHRADTGKVHREDYVAVYRLLSMELLGGEIDEVECEEEALEEWHRDSVDGEVMERMNFLDAIFEGARHSLEARKGAPAAAGLGPSLDAENPACDSVRSILLCTCVRATRLMQCVTSTRQPWTLPTMAPSSRSRSSSSSGLRAPSRRSRLVRRRRQDVVRPCLGLSWMNQVMRAAARMAAPRALGAERRRLKVAEC